MVRLESWDTSCQRRARLILPPLSSSCMARSRQSGQLGWRNTVSAHRYCTRNPVGVSPGRRAARGSGNGELSLEGDRGVSTYDDAEPSNRPKVELTGQESGFHLVSVLYLLLVNYSCGSWLRVSVDASRLQMTSSRYLPLRRCILPSAWQCLPHGSRLKSVGRIDWTSGSLHEPGVLPLAPLGKYASKSRFGNHNLNIIIRKG
ncbi:hypothetical protein B0T20DRAFT_468714, partial [Sordaria brevicollis]